jgi:hypothetical protein
MPLTVLRDGAAPLILSNETVFNQLPDDIDVIALLGAIRTGQPVPVTFRDGSKVCLASLNPQLQLEPPAQKALMLPLTMDRMFELECQILIPVDVTVQCRAPNKHAAMRMVSDVFAGKRPPAIDLRVEVSRDDVAETFHRLERSISIGAPSGLDVHDVLINRVEER